MPSRTISFGGFTALQKWRAAHVNAIPGGWLGYAEQTAAQTGIDEGGDDIADLSVTVTVPASRLIRVSLTGLRWVETSGGSAIQQVVTEIREGATVLARCQRSYDGLANVIRDTHVASKIIPPGMAGLEGPGSHTYKVHTFTVGSGAVIATEYGDGYPAQLVVEDLGPSS